MNLGSLAANRARRVALIVDAVPLSTDAARNLSMLERLENSTPAERAEFVRLHAGLSRPPSDDTWRDVVAVVRSRITPANGNAGDPADFITRGG